MVLLGEQVPDFTAPAYPGYESGLNLYSFARDKWCVLFSHPADFTPVCTTELAKSVELVKKFPSVQFVALSTDSIEDHARWVGDIQKFAGLENEFPFPIIADTDHTVANLYGMFEHGSSTNSNKTIRSVFVIGPDRQLKAMIAYPMTVGRGFDELARLLTALLMTESDQRLATPADWTPGQPCIIRPSVREEDRPVGYCRTDFDYLNYTA